MSESTQKFSCYSCSFNAKYDHFGKKPPFSKDIILLEDVYVMKDPFSDSKGCVLLGAHCSVCKKAVCMSQDCSIFYTKRLCVPCVLSNMDEVPEEVIQEIQRRKPRDE